MPALPGLRILFSATANESHHHDGWMAGVGRYTLVAREPTFVEGIARPMCHATSAYNHHPTTIHEQRTVPSSPPLMPPMLYFPRETPLVLLGTTSMHSPTMVLLRTLI